MTHHELESILEPGTKLRVALLQGCNRCGQRRFP